MDRPKGLDEQSLHKVLAGTGTCFWVNIRILYHDSSFHRGFSFSLSSVPYLHLLSHTSRRYTSKERWPRRTLRTWWQAPLVSMWIKVLQFSSLGSREVYEEAPFCLQAKRTGKWLSALEWPPISLTPSKSQFFQRSPFPPSKPMVQRSWLYFWTWLSVSTLGTDQAAFVVCRGEMSVLTQSRCTGEGSR